MKELPDKKILLIDDDAIFLQLISDILTREDAQIYAALGGEDGLRQFYLYQPDLVILDLMMPDLDGWEVCSRILQLADVPIILLTALGRDDDMVRGLESGAIDYIIKPINSKILVARVKAALRRSRMVSKLAGAVSYNDDHLMIDLSEHRILADGKPVRLTAREYQLLTTLFRSANRVLTFQQILYQVWGWEYQNNVDYVHVYISHLRQKLEPDPKNPQYILTEYGIGYQFVKQSSG